MRGERQVRCEGGQVRGDEEDVRGVEVLAISVSCYVILSLLIFVA